MYLLYGNKFFAIQPFASRFSLVMGLVCFRIVSLFCLSVGHPNSLIFHVCLATCFQEKKLRKTTKLHCKNLERIIGSIHLETSIPNAFRLLGLSGLG